MENKILVADDSPTIQKVISITLANKDYELEMAQSEDELYEKLNNETYALVLLDYNLSETSTGAVLAKHIKEKNSTTLVMAMLGTFDSIEESELVDAGFSDKIVKPFESSKFIEKIESMLNGPEEVEKEDFRDPDSIDTDGADDSDEWSIDGPSVIEEEDLSPIENENENENENLASDPLVAEISGWGMSVPEVIGAAEEDSSSLLPPFIEATEVVSFSDSDSDFEFVAVDKENDSSDEEEDKTGEVQIPDELEIVSKLDEEALIFPEDTDLSYPEMSTENELTEELENESNKSTDNKPELTSLYELDTFDYEDDSDEDVGITDPQIIIGPSQDSPDLVNALNDDISPDDFWATDIEEKVSEAKDDFSIDEHPSIEDTPKTNELNDTSKITLDALSDVSSNLEKVDHESLAQQIKTELLNELKPLIKEMVQEVLDEGNSAAVEKVAWEVIPDLAENLIRKEVKELSQRVMDKHSLN